MEAIEKMASLCMRDPDEDEEEGTDEEDVEADDDLLVSSRGSCVQLCDPMEHNPPGSSFHGILPARVLEWVAISFSRGSSQPRD